MDNSYYSPSKEEILKAAEDHPSAKPVLMRLHPWAFEDDTYFIFPHTVSETALNPEIKWPFDPQCIDTRTSGQYAYKGLFLSPTIDWKIVWDDEGIPVLVPTKKLD